MSSQSPYRTRSSGGPATLMHPTVDDPKQLEGTVLDGRYRLEQWLGSGGMGSVFRAQQLSLERPVAVKLLRPKCQLDYAHRRRFLREARVASTIEHPNVARVFDFGHCPEGHTYLVMEYLPGQDLAKRLRGGGTLPWSQVRTILLQAVAGLQAAHEEGVVHRDIKPSNVFLVEGRDAQPDFVRVLDFGLAKAVDPESSLAEALTVDDEVMGTVQYMGPERIRGERADVRSDIYALGVMAYRMLAGVLPLWGTRGSVARRMMRRLTDDPPPIGRQVMGLPAGVEPLIQRAMARSASDRFESCVALARALEAATGDSPAHVVHSPWSSGPRSISSGVLRDTRPLSAPPNSSGLRPPSPPS